MRQFTKLLFVAPVTFGLLAAPAAHAEKRHHEGGEGGWGHQGGGHQGWNHQGWGHQGWGHQGMRYHHGHGGGGYNGALLGLGAAAVIGGIIASQQDYYQPPRVYYQPQPRYYQGPVYSQWYDD